MAPGPADQSNARITRNRFVQIPLAILEQCAERKGVAFVYGWLWHYAGREDAAWPSIDRLALECRMKRDDVRAALKWLCAEGWVTREDRPGATTIFHVRGENPSPKRGTPPPNGGSPKRGVTPLPQMGGDTPPPKGATNNKHLTRSTEQEEDSPSIPLTDPTPAAPVKEARKATTVHPLTADLPPALEQHRQAIADFWAAKRKGSAKSPAAFALLLKNLQQIHDADPSAVASQLEAGTQAGWSSITFPNWQAYGQRPVRIGNGSNPRYVSHRDRNAAEVEEALDLLALMDPAHAEPDRVQRVHGFTTTTTAIDWENMPRA